MSSGPHLQPLISGAHLVRRYSHIDMSSGPRLHAAPDRAGAQVQSHRHVQWTPLGTSTLNTSLFLVHRFSLQNVSPSFLDGTKVAQFCGHRLHVHPRFRLYLTTVSPLSSIPASLLSDLNVINLSPSIPLSQDVLLNETIRVLLPDESSHFVVVCEEIARGKERLGALEAELFASLPKEGRTESYWQSTEKISKIVDQKMEVKINVPYSQVNKRKCLNLWEYVVDF